MKQKIVFRNITDIENLFGRVDKKDYYKPILVESSFKGNYKYYESRGDRKKIISKTISLQDYTIFT